MKQVKNDDATDKGSKHVSKFSRLRQLSIPPPTLNTQLPFKLEEEENDDEEEFSNNSSDTNSFEVIK